MSLAGCIHVQNMECVYNQCRSQAIDAGPHTSSTRIEAEDPVIVYHDSDKYDVQMTIGPSPSCRELTSICARLFDRGHPLDPAISQLNIKELQVKDNAMAGAEIHRMWYDQFQQNTLQ